jgi:hypothetical protein
VKAGKKVDEAAGLQIYNIGRWTEAENTSGFCVFVIV